MSEKKTAKERSKATRAKKRKPEEPQDITVEVPSIISDRFYKGRLHVNLEPRQGRALRAIFDGMFFEGTIDDRGREVTTQESALRVLLDRAADAMGYPRKKSDKRP